ncbi:keratin-associated protein 10-6-like isoform X1 [Nylanderia fulva]|uniref:keratin-associated protein 10-6-like isoform X1 n=1 Tax=Nylanderia fulva TaxID=613905 RepID=UPI0010FAEF51|nr:keratin-associated protein 10-6-like isoform X1 [Nylanderia fulva]
MFKLCIFAAIFAAVCAAPKPGAVLAAPAVAAVPAPIVTASSSQVIARNYNTLAAAPCSCTLGSCTLSSCTLGSCTLGSCTLCSCTICSCTLCSCTLCSCTLCSCTLCSSTLCSCTLRCSLLSGLWHPCRCSCRLFRLLGARHSIICLFTNRPDLDLSRITNRWILTVQASLKPFHRDDIKFV